VSSRVFDYLPDDTWFYPGHGDDSTLGRAEASHRIGLTGGECLRAEWHRQILDLCLVADRAEDVRDDLVLDDQVFPRLLYQTRGVAAPIGSEAVGWRRTACAKQCRGSDRGGKGREAWRISGSSTGFLPLHERYRVMSGTSTQIGDDHAISPSVWKTRT
jgi:hypothetical protein